MKDVMGRKSGSVAVSVNGIEKDMSHFVERTVKSKPIMVNLTRVVYPKAFMCTSTCASSNRIVSDAKPTIGPPIEHGFYYDFSHGSNWRYRT